MTCRHRSLFFLVPVGTKDDAATVPNRIGRSKAASWRHCHLIFSVATCQLLGTSDATNGRTSKCMTCRHRSLFFLVPVGTKDDAATVPNRIGRSEAASWRHCHLIFSVATCQLLGTSDATNGRTSKCMTCRHRSLFFLVPVGTKDDAATVPNRIGRSEAASWRHCHLIFRVATCQLLGTSDATNGRTSKCMTCRHRSLFFLVPVGTKDDAATVPNRIGRSKAASWRHCHLIFRVATCQLLGTSDATNGRTSKCMTCRHRSLFFLVPVGTKDDAATVPNRIGRSKAASWRHCHLIFGVATCQLLGTSDATNGRTSKCMTCRHRSLFFLVACDITKMMLQQFQTG